MARKRARNTPEPVSQEAALLASRPDLEPPPVDFLAYEIAPDQRAIQHAVQYDLAAIQHRLEAIGRTLDDLELRAAIVAHTYPVLARDMRARIAWLRACALPDIDTRTVQLVRGLALDAIPGSKQRPGRSEGGKTRALNKRRDAEASAAQWQRDAEALAHKNSKISLRQAARVLAEQCPKDAHPPSFETIRKALKKTW
jgi:hypothetical protein